MAKKYENFTTLKFGRWTPIEEVVKEGKKSRWLCRCDCGDAKVVDKYALTSGKSKSCGCLLKEWNSKTKYKHGVGYDSRIYRIWHGMRTRCYNTKSKDYPNYGGRGITTISEWGDFQVFRKWALQNGYDPDLSIDRIDNDKGYSPENCRWVDAFVQNANRRCCVK